MPSAKTTCLTSLLLFTIGALMPTHAQTVIDTTSTSNTGSWFNSPYVGQTFKAPASSVLTSFSFFLSQDVNYYSPFYPIDFDFSLIAVDAATNTPTGPVLFTSAPASIPAGPPNGFLEYTFNTGGLTLKPAQEYFAYVTNLSRYAYAPAFEVTYYTDGQDAYADGSMEATGSLTSPLPDTSAFLSGMVDTAFIARFSPAVPEPSPKWALLAGLPLVLLPAWRRRKGDGSQQEGSRP